VSIRNFPYGAFSIKLGYHKNQERSAGVSPVTVGEALTFRQAGCLRYVDLV